mgnify:CR=1 FL=1
MQEEAQTVVSQVAEENSQAHRKETSLAGVKSSAEKQQVKIYRSLLEHWLGLILFMQHPEVPLDNNLAENAFRNPINGRKDYYGSGSILSAMFAAILFSMLQTAQLWNLNPHHWLYSYLKACAENGGQPPKDLTPFIPWQMDEARRKALSLPLPHNKQSP